MASTASLRQLRVERPAEDEPGSQRLRLRGLLVVSGNSSATTLIAVDDAIELLVALLSNLPYRAFGQEVRTRRVGAHDIQLDLVTSSGLRTTLTQMPYATWYQTVMSMISRTAEELTAQGEGELIYPLLAVLHDASDS